MFKICLKINYNYVCFFKTIKGNKCGYFPIIAEDTMEKVKKKNWIPIKNLKIIEM